ncbi:MAG TPA: replication-relaxation family protein, partial [Solirubrobacteraceae bacterium]
LPKHHAIASWTTPEGRQAPFIAQTIPLRTDQERLAFHAARQFERGGRHCSDLRQPHWSSPVQPRTQAPPAGTPAAPEPDRQAAPIQAEPLPATAAESYRELVELDSAHSVRWASKVATPSALDTEELDLEILALIGTLRHVLTSQLHRRFNPARSITTTQRRLKRLSDAGLVERFQFYRRDGGGVPMCYVISGAGLRLLQSVSHPGIGEQDDHAACHSSTAIAPGDGERRLAQARRDVHVAGWAFALERLHSPLRCAMRGPEQSVLSPPLRSGGDGRARLAPGDLRLPGGRTPHDFLRTGAGGEMLEVEHFETVRPDAIVELAGSRPRAGGSGDSEERSAVVDVLVELDDRLRSPRATAKLERYDHFISGWALHTKRYGRRQQANPLLVFVCRDRTRARDCARAADGVLKACRAYAGEYPFDWNYPARESILFASERDIHEGLSRAYGVPRLPPEVRVAAANGDARAREAVAEPMDLLEASGRAADLTLRSGSGGSG